MLALANARGRREREGGGGTMPMKGGEEGEGGGKEKVEQSTFVPGPPVHKCERGGGGLNS